MKKYTILFSLVLLAISPHADESKTTDLENIVRHLDELYRSKSAYMEVDMTVQTPYWKRTMGMEIWSEGLTKTFITILSPRKDKGISTLRAGNEMWNFFPKINKVMKIPPSMMMGSWMGSDFTNDDLVKESTMLDDYNATLIDKPNDQTHYHIELKPKEQTVSVWGKIVAIVEKETLLPVQQDYYDEKDRRMRIMYFKEIKELGGKIIPSVIELVPQNKKGHTTIIRHLKAKFDIEFDKNVFTLRNLQKKRH